MQYLLFSLSFDIIIEVERHCLFYMEKNIHYVWLGKKSIPTQFQEFINKWKELMSDYTFFERNEETFDVESNEWVKKAIEAKNYALAADVIRSWALVNYGGIYFDTDVEVLKSFNELVEKYSFFIGYETNCWFGCAILGASKGHPIMVEVYKRYQQPCPTKINARSNMRCVLNFLASIQRLHKLKLNKKMIELPDNAVILPRDYFFPKHYITKKMNITKNTMCIHHYGGTWHSSGKVFGIKIASFVVNLIGDSAFGFCFERIARKKMLSKLKKEYEKREVI